MFSLQTNYIWFFHLQWFWQSYKAWAKEWHENVKISILHFWFTINRFWFTFNAFKLCHCYFYRIIFTHVHHHRFVTQFGFVPFFSIHSPHFPKWSGALRMAICIIKWVIRQTCQSFDTLIMSVGFDSSLIKSIHFAQETTWPNQNSFLF